MNIDLPEYASWLDVPFAKDGFAVRHRVLFGGRGGAKSWSVATKLIERARRSRERILCTREFQNSIRDSSKKLLEDTIDRLGYGATGDGFFTFTDREIRGRNGSVFSFLGLNGRDAAIKSLEGYTLAWVEEAATVSQSSIDALIPTIRQAGSEIWWTYNPRFETDPVDKLFRGDGNPPPGSIVVEVQWCDNKWFPNVLARDMEYDQRRDPDKHDHVWLGGYLRHSEARVFHNWTSVWFETPDDAVFRLGADWGYAIDPTVLVRCFIGRWAGEPGLSEVIADQKGNCVFIDYEAYQVGCTIDNTPALFAGYDTLQLPPRWPNPSGERGIPGAARLPIFADNARPETIDYMKRRGFNIKKATKGPGSVEDGINFLTSYDIFVHPRCSHAATELTHYSWKVDRQTGEILNKLADANNHVIDALRYALEGLRKVGGPVSFMSSETRTSLSGFGGAGLGLHSDQEFWERESKASGSPTSQGWGSVPGNSRGIMSRY